MAKRYNKQSSPKITATLAGKIKWLWNHTHLNQAQIAANLGALNQGRVSEVINGTHKHASAPEIEVPEALKYG